MANAPLKIKRFPAELWDLSKPQSFDNWFIKTWSNKNAINIPSKCDLNAKAVVLARATVRQAWLSALEASTSHIRKPAFDAYKSVSVQTKELKTNFDGLIKFLQYRGEPPNGQEAEIQSLTRNVLLWLEASPLDEEGDFVAHDFESCSKFAASLLETRKFLSAL